MLVWPGYRSNQFGQFVNSATYKRAKDAYAQSLYGNGIKPTDIMQGQVADCWMISPAAELALYPQRVKNAFIN